MGGDVVGRSDGFLDTLRGGLKKTMEQGEAREEQQSNCDIDNNREVV